MHPEIMRQLTAQRGRELRDRAYRAQLARTMSRDSRARRRGARHSEADVFVVPSIPDYVDGSFRSAGDRVPAARRAA
jgi:hypothetical protein